MLAVTGKCNLTKLTTKSAAGTSSQCQHLYDIAGQLHFAIALVFSSVAVPERFWSKNWAVSSTSLVSLSTSLCPSPLPPLSVTGTWRAVWGLMAVGCGDCQPWERYALSMAWLAPGYPALPSFIQHDAVVN